jgi:hypothetical protein
MRSLRRLLGVATVAVAVLGVGCGGEEQPPEPRALPEGLVPTTIPDPTDEANPLQLVEFTAAREQFKNAGERSLVDDGALWELRRGSNLVGTVEVAMLDRKIDVTSPDDRRKLIRAVLPGTATTIKVQGISVVRTASDDKVTYLVIGNGLFQLVDVKLSDKVDPDHIIAALIKAELPTGHLTIAGEQRRRPL